MKALRTLVALRLRLLRNAIEAGGSRAQLKLGLLGLVALGFMLLEGAAAASVFGRLAAHQDLGGVFVLALVERLLALVFLTSLTMLVFSNAITALQTLYVSRDLDLLMSTPVPVGPVFALKLAETVILSSYVVVAFTVPILVGYGLSFEAGPLFYVQLLPALVVYVLVPAGLGVAATVALMRWVPARRAHQVLTVMTLAVGVALVLLLRLTRPERLLGPADEADLKSFLAAITLPGADYLPSSWAARLQMAAIGGDNHALWLNAALLGGAAAFTLGLAFVAAGGYRRGLQAVHDAPRRAAPRAASLPLGLPGRDLRIFVRDPSQWSQLLLLGALVILYVFNMTALPRDMLIVDGLRLKDLVSWLNGALAGLVLAAVGLRFVLPSTSLEGGAFWAIASSPASRRRYVLSKFLFYLPLVLFGELLVLVANLALGVGGAMMGVTLATAGLASVAITGLGVGLGAAFPVFKLENPAQMMLSAGGILYGVSAFAYLFAILALQAEPVWRFLVEGRVDTALLIGRALLVVGVSGAVTAAPLFYGGRRLEELEF